MMCAKNVFHLVMVQINQIVCSFTGVSQLSYKQNTESQPIISRVVLDFIFISLQVVAPAPFSFPPAFPVETLLLPDYQPWDVGVFMWQLPWR